MKRTKLFASLIMCVLCLSFLVVGVWAAVSVTFNMNVNLQYYPDGVYVALNGQVYIGDSLDNLNPLYGDNYTYEAHNFDDTQPEQTGTYPIESWVIGNLSFAPNAKYIKLEVTVTNYSDFEIIGIPTLSGGVTTNDNITVTAPEFAFAYVGDVGTYELILELTGTTAISGSDITVAFDFEQAVADSTAFTYSGSTATLKSSYTTNHDNILIMPVKNGSTDIINYSTMTNLQQENVIILDGLVSLANYTFMSNSKIKNITLPASLSSLGNMLFDGCSKLEKVNFADGIQITNLPSSCFNNCSSLVSINVPKSIKTIYSGAFRNCSNLNGLSFSENLETIDITAFYGCSSLTSIKIPSSVTSIGASAFTNCTSLNDVTIDSFTIYQQANSSDACGGLLTSAMTVKVNKNIDDNSNAYLNGVNFKKSVVPEGDYFVYGSPADYSYFTFSGNTITGLTSTYTADAPDVLYVPGKTQSGEAVSIGSSAFSSAKLSSSQVIILEGAVSIGAAFTNSTTLTSITIPSSVTSIDYGAFVGCENLDTFNATGIYTTLDNGNLLMKGTEIVGFAPSGITSYNIPSTVTSIADETFRNTTNLSEIYLPSRLTNIGGYAFLDSGLKTVTIPSSVTNIGDSAFSSTALQFVFIEGNGERTFGDHVFDKNFNLQEVVLAGDNIIGSSAFIELTNLRLVTLKEGTSVQIGENAFAGSTLREIVFEQNSYISQIGESAFNSCTSLTGLSFPEGLETIGNYAFKNSTLESVSIPYTIQTIGVEAFYGCPLYRVVLDSLDTFIGLGMPSADETLPTDGYGNLFANNPIIQIPSDAITIDNNDVIDGRYGYCYVSGLTETQTDATKYYSFVYTGAETGLSPNQSWFDIDGSTGQVYDFFATYDTAAPSVLVLPGVIYSGSEDAWIPVDYSSFTNFANELRPNTTTIIVLDGAYGYNFNDLPYVENIIFLTNDTEIPMGNLSVCSNLQKVVFPKTLTTLGNDILKDCPGLKEVVIPEQLTTLGSGSFTNSTSVELIIKSATIISEFASGSFGEFETLINNVSTLVICKNLVNHRDVEDLISILVNEKGFTVIGSEDENQTLLVCTK